MPETGVSGTYLLRQDERKAFKKDVIVHKPNSRRLINACLGRARKQGNGLREDRTVRLDARWIYVSLAILALYSRSYPCHDPNVDARFSKEMKPMDCRDVVHD